jgi:hypothetical protein
MNERMLAAAIIQNAMEEWEVLIHTRLRPSQLYPGTVATVERRLNSLRAFFRSPWCDVLMCGESEGEELLKRLDAEYRQSYLCKQIAHYKAKARI